MPAAVETMAYQGAVPWHGEGSSLAESDLYDWPATCRKAGLDWDVELAPLVTADDGTAVRHNAVRRTTDKRVLGVVGPKFVPLQNRDAFAWFQPFLASREASLHTAGALKGGRRVWVLAKLNREPMEIVPGDVVEKYILLSHGHDGSLAVRAGFTPVRVVCQNTLAAAHDDTASKLIRIKHTKGVLGGLEEIRGVMNLANQEFEATAEQYRRLAARAVSPADLKKYVRRVFKADRRGKDGAERAVSGRLRNILEAVEGLAACGKGNLMPGVRGTLWGAYNGVSEFVSHERGKAGDKRLDSLWFGAGASLNRRALEVALEMAG